MVKLPPAYTVELFAVSALTVPFSDAAKPVSRAPVAVLKAASRLWVAPSTVVNSPPT